MIKNIKMLKYEFVKKKKNIQISKNVCKIKIVSFLAPRRNMDYYLTYISRTN